MPTYYIKKYGVHELHQNNCVWLPIRKGMTKLGDFDTDEEALEKASNRFEEISPCRTCCNISRRQHVSTSKKK